MSGAGTIAIAFHGTLGGFQVDAACTVPARGITALFGPSGCGKTTVLRCVAGLMRLPGRCVVDGEVWQDGSLFRPPHRRAVGYVFQEASLFPHLSVEGNLLYGAGGRRPQSGGGRVGFDDAVALLGLASLLDRAPRHLSGGERQRVAIGRALLSQPKLLLMDEPLSALDRQSRDEILPFLERIHESLAVPVFYVTHDMAEVERLADALVLMEMGHVRASGTLADLQSDPTLPIAGVRGAAVSIDATVVEIDADFGLTTLEAEGARFIVPGLDVALGARRRLRIAAGDVSLSRSPPPDSTILNLVPARIETATPVGEHEVLVLLRAGSLERGPKLLARVTRRSWSRLGLAAGLNVIAQVKSVALVRPERS